MKLIFTFILVLSTITTHQYRREDFLRNSQRMRPVGYSPRVKVIERTYPNQNEVLPQFVDEVERTQVDFEVCGVNGQTYPNRDTCPVRVAHLGRCRPAYAYDTYWYMPHGWELYQPDGKPRRSRDLYGYHQHVMPPYFHA